MDFSFRGGLEGAEYNAPSAVVAFVKGTQLVVADQGDQGEIVSATWTLENWIQKVTGEMGYLLLFGGLVHAEMKPLLFQVFEKVAMASGLTLEHIPEWQG